MKRLLVGVICLVAIGAVLYVLSAKATSPPLALPAPETQKQPNLPAVKEAGDTFGGMTTPHTLIIPSLNVTSPIHPVGLTKNGDMDIPDSLQDTGWYNQSANPGNPGRAVLAAHTGYPNKPSEFRRLGTIKPNATLQVKDQAGKTATFSVIETKIYPANAAPTHIIFGESPTARLNLITCTGKWNAATNSYSDRLVIFTARTD